MLLVILVILVLKVFENLQICRSLGHADFIPLQNTITCKTYIRKIDLSEIFFVGGVSQSNFLFTSEIVIEFPFNSFFV